MCRTASMSNIVYYFSSYAFNGLNLFTNYPDFAYNGVLPGIGGQKLGAVKNSARDNFGCWNHLLSFPYSWHQPKSLGRKFAVV